MSTIIQNILYFCGVGAACSDATQGEYVIYHLFALVHFTNT